MRWLGCAPIAPRASVPSEGRKCTSFGTLRSSQKRSFLVAYLPEDSLLLFLDHLLSSLVSHLDSLLPGGGIPFLIYPLPSPHPSQTPTRQHSIWKRKHHTHLPKSVRPVSCCYSTAIRRTCAMPPVLPYPTATVVLVQENKFRRVDNQERVAPRNSRGTHQKMLSASQILYLNKASMKHRTKLRHRFRNPLSLPLRQTQEQRNHTIREVLKHKRINPGDHSAFRYVEQRLYSKGSRLDREGLSVNTVYGLQGLGDLEPLRNSRNFGCSEREAMKYDSPQEIAKYEAPPVPFTPLAARKLAEGKLWPAAPEPSGMTSKEVRFLRHRSNMSPSSQTFSDKVAYHIRRALKACPGHIGERIDFAQLIIQEVIASRRSKELYIVWTTVDPGSRFEMEPHLHRLNNWVQRLVMERIRTRPNIPHVSWVYDGNRLERELPRTLKEEIKNLAGEVTSSLDSRVQYLKELDTVNQRMKDVPWFMPYLWNKEEKAGRTKQMRKDLEEYEQRRGVALDQHKQHTAQWSSTNRSTAAQTRPPPSYQR